MAFTLIGRIRRSFRNTPIALDTGGIFSLTDAPPEQGASPNRGIKPRLVQCITMVPTRVEERKEWI